MNAEQSGPVQVVIAWPATIYVTVEVGADGGQRITGSEVLADADGADDQPAGWVYDVRRVGSGLDPVPGGDKFAGAALAFVASESWPNPTLNG